MSVVAPVSHDAGRPDPGTPSRSVVGYLLLPRPGDTVKWLIVPLGFLVGSLGRGAPDTDALVRALLVWSALELLVYQARYQWNDIRGFEADQQHPDGDRGRLPGPLERRRARVTASATTALVKVVGAVALCWAVDATTALAMAALTAGVFALAAVYEALRSRCTGRTDTAPSPITPGVVAIWVVIGAGYALRAVTGLGLAVGLTRPGPLLPVAVATCWAFGVAWITSRWAIEATAYAHLDGGRVRWRCRRTHAREHQLALVRWLPHDVPASVSQLRYWRAARGPAPWSAPWTLAGVATASGALLTGALLTTPDASPARLTAAAGLGALTGAVVLAAGSHRGPVVLLLVPLVVAGLVVVGVHDPARACGAWVVVAVAQVRYLRQHNASMGRFLRRPLRDPGAST